MLPQWGHFSALTLSVRSIRPNPLRVFPSCPFCPPGLRPSFFSPSLAFSGFLSKSVEGRAVSFSHQNIKSKSDHSQVK
ncbi:unknown protein [Microcystis aeruginosa NIES-843]|uniref:Uncharacterized protein n=1 Tax=Microcystis aeruginosa (strain NIES-843 / IAM M-2473) TaxID=449447 RepID=B0JWE7_MICAN|nr:unknown protein [Microcystis aeruginosa NIES-843]